MSRIDKIRSMLQDDPQDVFLRYALAMELDSVGQFAESLATYQQLMNDQPPHVPSYFRTGQLLMRMGELPQAAETLQRGIELARAQGDLHAAGEMTELLQSLDQSDDL
jgi:tetratricopeptide (TPR) repeat protein